jgi:hypothetical protein
VILLERACNWVRDGTSSIGGGLFILNTGRVVWTSSRINLPVCEWSLDLLEIKSVGFVEGSWARKAQAPFAPSLRDTCELVLDNGNTKLLLPAQIATVLLEASELAPTIGTENALVHALGPAEQFQPHPVGEFVVSNHVAPDPKAPGEEVRGLLLRIVEASTVEESVKAEAGTAIELLDLGRGSEAATAAMHVVAEIRSLPTGDPARRISEGEWTTVIEKLGMDAPS